MRPLPTLTALLIPLAAQADTLDDFVLLPPPTASSGPSPPPSPTNSPPATRPPGHHIGIDTHSTSAAGTIDGAPAHLGFTFITQDGALIGSGFTLYPNASTANYRLRGPILVPGPDVDFPTRTFNDTDSGPIP